MTAETA